MPLSTNQLYRTQGVRRFLTAKGRECKESIGWEARTQYRKQPMKGSVRLKIALYWPTRRNHDVDNIKALLDALTGILWEDDGQVTDLHILKYYDKGNPHVQLEFAEISG